MSRDDTIVAPRGAISGRRWNGIDEEADLAHLRTTLASDGAAAPMTWAALEQLGLLDRSPPLRELAN